MCFAAIGVAAGATAGTAAATTTGVAIAGLAVSAAAAGLGIVQAQQSAQFQADSARQQQDLAYRQAQQQTSFQNQALVNKHIGQVKAQQAKNLAANYAYYYGDQSANQSYISQQLKFKEASDKAAFKSQEIYAKQIGSKGKILATGARGKSVGLLALDAERRAGFAQSQQDATVRSAEMAMGTSMEGTRLKALSNINTIGSRVDFPVQAPQLAPEPVGIGENLNLGIPSYNWA
ncbi:internal virion protein [Cyanophage SS120-1]|uniref:Internal virion protein n=1 Tax=Cyanophage SS120-1 TaxID=616674 RepID=M1TVT8_9CAUD|nr:internal virion protein [Cyanophage SS120-1]AGG54534.1 hypothetical protein CYYG_00033 [Cyanophage SS120-1]